MKCYKNAGEQNEDACFSWAWTRLQFIPRLRIESFRLSVNTDPKTQIHTHMCYSEFGEIVEDEAIATYAAVIKKYPKTKQARKAKKEMK